MKVICAGMEKTGTKSMATALRALGFKTYDFVEHLHYHMEEWVGVYKHGRKPDFLAMYNDVDAVTDQPPCYFWQEILEAFPNSKVVLMVRDSEDVWADSLVRFVREMKKNIMALMPSWMLLPTGKKLICILNGNALISGRKLLPDSRDVLLLKKIYRQHNALVKALVPKEKLLVFNVKQGWKPLCDFLGCDVPDYPFPRENVTGVSDPMDSFSAPDHVVFVRRVSREMNIILFGCAVLLIIVVLMILRVSGLM